MIVDINDWESEDWDVTIPAMMSWIDDKGLDAVEVWPLPTQGTLHFKEVNDAIEFILRWS